MNVYSVLHHIVDKLPARDEAQLRDLHDTITAHELGFNSLEELNEERRLQAAKIDPAAAAAAWEAAQSMLAQVKSSQEQIVKLLETAEAGRKAQEQTAQEQAKTAIAEAAPVTSAPAFPQPERPASTPTAPAGPSVEELEAQLAAARAARDAG